MDGPSDLVQTQNPLSSGKLNGHTDDLAWFLVEHPGEDMDTNPEHMEVVPVLPMPAIGEQDRDPPTKAAKLYSLEEWVLIQQKDSDLIQIQHYLRSCPLSILKKWDRLESHYKVLYCQARIFSEQRVNLQLVVPQSHILQICQIRHRTGGILGWTRLKHWFEGTCPTRCTRLVIHKSPSVKTTHLTNTTSKAFKFVTMEFLMISRLSICAGLQQPLYQICGGSAYQEPNRFGSNSV